jgi:tight adherence protein B
VNPLAHIPDRYFLPAVAGIVFVALLALGFALFAPLFDYAQHRRRVSQIEQFRLQHSPPPPPTEDHALAQAALAVSSQLMKARAVEDEVAARLERAGMRIRPNEWILVRVVATVVGALVLILPLGPLIGVPFGALLGFIGTDVYRRIRTERRYQAFASQLPDALQLVVGSLRAGFSFPQAIDAMAKESVDPVAIEFSRALAETRLGANIEDALARLAGRMRSKDLEWVVVAVRIQREVGGNLAEVLSTNVATMREREGLRRHVRALSAEGRVSAYILVPLPVVALIMMLTLRTAYVKPLFTTATGVSLLALAGTLIAAGAAWMWRMVKVEV